MRHRVVQYLANESGAKICSEKKHTSGSSKGDHNSLDHPEVMYFSHLRVASKMKYSSFREFDLFLAMLARTFAAMDWGYSSAFQQVTRLHRILCDFLKQLYHSSIPCSELSIYQRLN